MPVLKRTLILAFAAFVLSFSYAGAQIVQVSDLGAYALTNRINQIASYGKTPMKITDMKSFGKMKPGDPYTLYFGGVGGNGHGALIFFYVNDAGYVSKMNIMANASDSISTYDSGYITGAMLIALGASRSELSILLSNRLREAGHTDVWCAAAKRRIIVQYHIEDNTRIYKIFAINQ